MYLGMGDDDETKNAIARYVQQQQSQGQQQMGPDGRPRSMLGGAGPYGGPMSAIANPNGNQGGNNPAGLPPPGPGGAMPPSWLQQRQDPEWQQRNMSPQANGNAYGQSNAGQAAAMQAAQRIGAGAGGMMGAPMGGAMAAPMGAAVAGGAAPAAQAGAMQAAKGGAMSAAMPVVGVIAQYLDKQRQNRALANQGRQQILQQRSAELGYPQYGIEAAQNRHAQAMNEGQNYLAPLLKMYGRG